MKLRLTCLLLLTVFTAQAQTLLDGAWTKLKSSPGVTEVRQAVDEVEKLIAAQSPVEPGEYESILNYAGYLAHNLQEYGLAVRAYELIYTNRFSINASVALLIAMNLTDQLEYTEAADIHEYEIRLKKAAGYYEEYLKTRPDDFMAYYNRGALYYNYIVYIQSHKIYDYDKNTNAAVLSRTSLEKAVSLKPDDKDAADLLHAVKLILGEGGNSSINFNEGK